METNSRTFTRGAAEFVVWCVAQIPRCPKVDEPAISGDTSWLEEYMVKPPKMTKTFWLSEAAAGQLEEAVSAPEGDRSFAACVERLVRQAVEKRGLPKTLPLFKGTIRKVLSLAPDVVQALNEAGPSGSQIVEYLLNPSRNAAKGETLRAARIQKGMTQVEVARRLGINVSAYKRIEHGAPTSMPPELAAKITSMLGVGPKIHRPRPKKRSVTAGAAIREKRRAKGLTQAALAELVGTSRALIAALELNTSPLTEEMAKRLAGVLRCSWEFFFD